MVMRIITIATILSFFIVSCEGMSQPNIVFILADDLGYGELGSYGQEKIKTPHLDRLAKEGLRLTQHYTGAPVCAPARCVLLTGKNLAHSEIRGNKEIRPIGQQPLSSEALTIAEVFKKRGYKTGAFGKWGLGAPGTSGDPNNQGFDYFFGYNCQRNAHSYYPEYLQKNQERIQINKNPIPGHLRKLKGIIKGSDYRSETYAPDLILAESLNFIDKHKNSPFFLYLPFVEPHMAMQSPQEIIDRYPKEWDDVALGGKGPYNGKKGYLPHDRPRAAYAAMISDLDDHVGAVLSRLKKLGLDQNTIIIFTSDNGPTWNGLGGADPKFFNSTSGLRGYKGSCYEGGLRIPCIVKWPNVIKPGQVSNAATYFPDWFPTLSTIANASLPKNNKLDGIDMLSLFKGGELTTRNSPMIWDFYEYGGIAAVRDGDWKIIRRNLRRKNAENMNWELYNIANDPEEKKDLAASHSNIVKRLEKAWLKTRTINENFRIPFVDGKKEL